MAEVRWSREAELWLKDIFDYIAEDNPVAATKVVTGIYDRARFWNSIPKSGIRTRKLKI